MEEVREDFEAIYFGELGMCGCGTPTELMMFIYELLKNHKQWKDEEITTKVMEENRKRIIKDANPDIVFEFIFHVLDKNDLLEHGVSIYSAWLTKKGEKFYDLLSKNITF